MKSRFSFFNHNTRQLKIKDSWQTFTLSLSPQCLRKKHVTQSIFDDDLNINCPITIFFGIRLLHNHWPLNGGFALSTALLQYIGSCLTSPENPEFATLFSPPGFADKCSTVTVNLNSNLNLINLIDDGLESTKACERPYPSNVGRVVP